MRIEPTPPDITPETTPPTPVPPPVPTELVEPLLSEVELKGASTDTVDMDLHNLHGRIHPVIHPMYLKLASNRSVQKGFRQVVDRHFDPSYPVEAIVAHRRQDGRLEYLVRNLRPAGEDGRAPPELNAPFFMGPNMLLSDRSGIRAQWLLTSRRGQVVTLFQNVWLESRIGPCHVATT
eukprot:COSAG02_NODE_180_length_31057_cov_21.869501_19_plen_178_part_00